MPAPRAFAHEIPPVDPVPAIASALIRFPVNAPPVDRCSTRTVTVAGSVATVPVVVTLTSAHNPSTNQAPAAPAALRAARVFVPDAFNPVPVAVHGDPDGRAPRSTIRFPAQLFVNPDAINV
jgi:hypothetical protein